MTRDDYERIGREILAAYDACQDWPDSPLYITNVGADERITVYRHGRQEGFGYAEVVRDGRPPAWAKAARCDFAWAAIRDQPERMAWYLVTDCRRTMDLMGDHPSESEAN